MALFQYGKFSAFDAAMTQRALVAYSVGLMGLIVVKVLAPGFYSRQDIKTPVKIAIVTLIMTQVMNLIFIGPLKHAGLSLSIGLAACLNAGLLYWQLRKQKIFTPQPGWFSFLLRLVVAVLVMSAAAAGYDVYHAGVVAGLHAVPSAAPDGGCGGGRSGVFYHLNGAGLPGKRVCPTYGLRSFAGLKKTRSAWRSGSFFIGLRALRMPDGRFPADESRAQSRR
ncbi:virulence factor MviN [Raoultella ornithinolytica]|nr:virulence factor MviN [Raoultella ornithinolytica]